MSSDLKERYLQTKFGYQGLYFSNFDFSTLSIDQNIYILSANLTNLALSYIGIISLFPWFCMHAWCHSISSEALGGFCLFNTTREIYPIRKETLWASHRVPAGLQEAAVIICNQEICARTLHCIAKKLDPVRLTKPAKR